MSGKEDRRTSGFAHVDATLDAADYISYLERLTQHESIRSYKRVMLSAINPQPGMKILDVGCGIGDDMVAILQIAPSARVVGIDSSRKMLEYARGRDPLKDFIPERASLGQANAGSLLFADNKFDVAYSNRTLQHVRDPHAALKEMIRVTKPGGKIVVADPDWRTLVIRGTDPVTADLVRRAELSIVRNSDLGGKAKYILDDEGLQYIERHDMPIVMRNLQEIQDVLWLDRSLQVAVDGGFITQEQADMVFLKMGQENTLSATARIYIHVGRKPPPNL